MSAQRKKALQPKEQKHRRIVLFRRVVIQVVARNISHRISWKTPKIVRLNPHTVLILSRREILLWRTQALGWSTGPSTTHCSCFALTLISLRHWAGKAIAPLFFFLATNSRENWEMLLFIRGMDVLEVLKSSRHECQDVFLFWFSCMLVKICGNAN